MNAWQTKGSLDTRVANSSAMTRAMAEGAGAQWMISGSFLPFCAIPLRFYKS